MEPGIDSGSLNLLHQLVGAGERMRITSYFAVHGKCEVRSPEISGENGRDRPGHATVRGRILRVAGRTRQRQPIWISREGRVASCRLDCSYRPPETECKLRIPAADAGIGISRPEHGHESRGI